MNGRSVGKIIEDRRKELGLTIEECSKKTRISKKFIEAIESDNYEIFPGEVYYLGFLRTYAQLLSLDANKLIHDYNKQKKIEEPAPLEELTKPLKKEIKLPAINKNYMPIILITVISVIIIIGIILLISIPKTEKTDLPSEQVKVKQQKNENEFVLLQRKMIKTFTPGQILVIPDGDSQYKLSIESFDTEKKEAKISIIDLLNPFIIKENDSITFDFNENGKADLTITINQINSNGISLTTERLTAEKGSGKLSDKNISIKTSETKTAVNEENVILTDKNQISVVITSNRNGYARLESDTEGIIEKFLRPSESIKIGGKNQVIFQITNASNMTVIVNNAPLNLPKEFIVYCIIKWIYDQQTDKYTLVTEFKK